MVPVITAIAGLALGAVVGFLYRKSVAAGNAHSIEARAQKLMLEAEREADSASKRALTEVRDEIASLRQVADDDIKSRRDEIARQERRMGDAESELKARIERVDSHERDLQNRKTGNMHRGIRQGA